MQTLTLEVQDDFMPKILALLNSLPKQSIKVKNAEEKLAGFGAWEDNRTTDEIIADIRNSRVSNRKNETPPRL